MPKMRGFKAEIWTDDKFVELSSFARLMFMGMWSYACDNGHLDDKPKQIKMRVLPTDDVNPIELIDEMVDLGMVQRSDGLLTIRKLREHQRIDERYFTWCDRCALDEIPERSREKYVGATQGTRGDTTGAQREHTLKEGRKEGEGESEGTAAGKPASTKKKAATRLPADWKPNDDHLNRCRDLGLDPALEFAKFRAHAEANDRRQVSWNAAFTQWLLSARPQGNNVRPLVPRASEPDEQGRIVLPPLPKGVFEQ